MKLSRVIVITALCLFSQIIQSLAQEYSGPEEDIKIILKNIEAFSNAYISGDYDALADAYTPDGIIFPPGAKIIEGREAIKKRWILPEGVKVPYHKVTPVKIDVIYDLAHDIGYYEGRTIRKDGSEVSWKGKYLIIWKKIDKEWKMYADAWNSVN